MSNKFVTSAAAYFLLHSSWQHQQPSSRPPGIFQYRPLLEVSFQYKPLSPPGIDEGIFNMLFLGLLMIDEYYIIITYFFVLNIDFS